MREWERSYKDGVRTYQVMLGNPRSFALKDGPRYSPELVNRMGVSVVCHGPYVTSLVAPIGSKHYKASCAYYMKLTEVCLRSGVNHIVAHVGARTVEQSDREARNSLETFLLQWSLKYGGSGMKFCLENDPGSSSGRRCGSLSFLIPILKEYVSAGVGMCYDTEHGYANGFTLDKVKTIERFSSLVGVLHLNAVPTYVECGSHLDRHSDTNFVNSKFPLQVYKDLVEIFKNSPGEVKVILERSGWDIAKMDWKEVQSWL